MSAYEVNVSVLAQLSGGHDFLSPLRRYNLPVAIVTVVFELVTPVALVLNLFVLVSCLLILSKQKSDRPALVFVAYNSLLDIFTIVADALVITGAVNSSLADVDDENLPTEDVLTQRCSAEKGVVSFTMFSSLGCVTLLTADRFFFIVRPLRYNEHMTLAKALILCFLFTALAGAAAVFYSTKVTLPWDLVCTFTHVLPTAMVVFWNAFFFLTWILMHAMYAAIAFVAMRHKRQMQRAQVPGPGPAVATTSRALAVIAVTVRPEDAEVTSSATSSATSSTLSLREQRPTPPRGSHSDDLRKHVLVPASVAATASSSAGASHHSKSKIATVIKTIRYIVVLLLVYSLVELPSVAVAIDDLFAHSWSGNSSDSVSNKCGTAPNAGAALPSDADLRVSLLRCAERLVSSSEAKCNVYSETPLDALPMCSMLAEMSHSMHLTKVFTLSLLGWVANTLADPIVYAFWYPVFKQNLLMLLARFWRKVTPDYVYDVS